MIAYLKHRLRITDYGGSKAWLAHWQSVVADAAGLYRNIDKVDWTRVERLVFVCKGNICRSPYGEYRARLLGWSAVSMGLEALAGSTADSQAIEAAARRNVDLRAHRSTRFSAQLLTSSDLVLGFEPWHLQQMRKQRGSSVAQMTLAGLWSQPRRPDIGDPHNRGLHYFDICYSLIDTGLQTMTACKRL
jgi:protein-tyrosine phosphatase